MWRLEELSRIRRHSNTNTVRQNKTHKKGNYLLLIVVSTIGGVDVVEVIASVSISPLVVVVTPPPHLHNWHCCFVSNAQYTLTKDCHGCNQG